MLRDAGIVPKLSQTAGEMPTLIAVVDSRMSITILPGVGRRIRCRFGRRLRDVRSDTEV